MSGCMCRREGRWRRSCGEAKNGETMTPTGKLHFFYVVGILVAIIIGLLTVHFSENAPVVSYISFSSTIASILLAIVAIVYSFISNNTISQSIGGLHQASTNISDSSASLNRVAVSIEKRFDAVDENIVETRRLVQDINMSSKSLGVITAKDENAIVASTFFSTASNFGKIIMYAVYQSHKNNKEFNFKEFCDRFVVGNTNYFLGWLMAIDAANIISMQSGDKIKISVQFINKELVQQIIQALPTAPDGSADPNLAWSKAKIKLVDEYFGIS